MTKKVAGLNARRVQTETKPGYHCDGNGLYLQVSSTGTKSWIFRFKSPITEKTREMGLGSTTTLSLALARERATLQRRILLDGLDPIDTRKASRLERKTAAARLLTFEQAATQCIAAKRHEWTNAKHADQWTSTLKTYAYPVVGALAISAIDTAAVMQVLEPIWVSKAETASRLRQRIEAVWDWSKARGYVDGENPARLRGHLDKLLPKTAKVKRVQHHPALPYGDINAFTQLLQMEKGVSPLALEFLILTAARTGEVIGARWGEIDLHAKVWTVPADRMKGKREHRVPLSTRATEILTALKGQAEPRPEMFVFPGWKSGTSLSNGAMLALLKKIERADITPHGFRSTFRDWASERTAFPNETVEQALAHTVKNQVEAAYRRGDQLEKRRKLMDAWAQYVAAKPKSVASSEF
ncbi:integrase arm-type DNA-binding domain-containing protein [Cupriavidus taiwanensis]|uniref:tyrosine-type recombinase/integrase n=1 Tax=Cupriavidus taiwanensis TaxID=164546 RepID=UPI000E1B2B03|nr:integrase arm-type DNA-binding domain-containing protein [Cupriavidus taiwanensis]SPA26888.1 P4 family integrase [Cupriavidus taiwanensis]